MSVKEGRRRSRIPYVCGFSKCSAKTLSGKILRMRLETKQPATLPTIGERPSQAMPASPDSCGKARPSSPVLALFCHDSPDPPVRQASGSRRLTCLVRCSLTQVPPEREITSRQQALATWNSEIRLRPRLTQTSDFAAHWTELASMLSPQSRLFAKSLRHPRHTVNNFTPLTRLTRYRTAPRVFSKQYFP